MAWTYKIANDFRPSEQESSLYEIATVYLQSEDKLDKSVYNASFSDNVQPYLGLHFGLKSCGECARLAQNKNLDLVYLNFIKKFQFPNPSQQDYLKTINDGILLAPLREMVKILYFLKQTKNSAAFLTYEEISNFIMYNSAVAKTDNINYQEIINSILEYRNNGSLPDCVAPSEEKDQDWIYQADKNAPGRSLNDLILTLTNANFILNLRYRKRIEFKDYEKYENYIKNIVNYNEFFITNPNWSKNIVEEKYLQYFNQNISNFSENTKNLTEAEYLSPEWFKEKSNNYLDIAEEEERERKYFIDKYGIDKIKSLKGLELLNTIFLNGTDSNLCYELEYNTNNRKLFGSIRGSNAYNKYRLFHKEGWWYTGSTNNPKKLELEDAIKLGTEIRDSIVNGASILEKYHDVNDTYGYKKIYDELFNIKYPIRMWVFKYYQMLFPHLLPTFYSDKYVNKIVELLNIPQTDCNFVNMGNISIYIKKCGISNVVFAHIYNDYCKDGINETETITDDNFDFISGYKTKYPRNRILFGAPGTGKSYKLNKEQEDLLKDGGECERVTFHPNYSYANFVGTYKPVPKIDSDGKNIISYEYVPGPFMRTLVKAIKNIEQGDVKPYILLIEEINRAEAASVFGEVFQLLDRNDKGVSEYSIQTSEDMRKYLAKAIGNDSLQYDKIKIPDNMFIWATMNSADQGVFPMDTAFKRRWDFEYIKINEYEDSIPNKVFELGKDNNKTKLYWNDLREAINDYLSSPSLRINEDKLLGPYFLSKKVLEGSNSDFIKAFKDKVLMYLFEDAAKQKRSKVFSIDTTKYSEICNLFDDKGIYVFSKEITDNIGTVNENNTKAENNTEAGE